mgnify:CR=1 FL=1
MTTNEKSKFSGFPEDLKGKYWPYPKIMDSYWHLLNGSEQKVLDFILRRTLGWNKLEDRISLTQFKHGIKTSDRRWVERGTGLRKDQTIINATRKLEKLGFIYVIRKWRKTNIYKLRVLTKTEDITNQKGGAVTPKKGDTITTRTKHIKTIGISFKNPKPYYQGNRLYKTDYGRWKLIPKNGGAHQDFVGHEWNIEWKN